MAVLTTLTSADYVTTQWSGGATTQLAIAPKGAVYADRSFLWRVSSATVELDESDFTALPDYDRLISTVRGDMTLSHNGGAELTLRPGDMHAFDGGDATHSKGRCTDFNLMLRKGKAAGNMCVLRADKMCDARLACEPGVVTLLYCVSGACTVRCGAQEAALTAGGSALVEENEGGEPVKLSAAEEAIVYAAQVW